MSYLKSIGTAFIYIGLFLAMFTFIPGLPPAVEFVEYSITPPRQFDPKLGPKNRLNGAQKLFKGEILGPESFGSYNGQLYTGVHGGYVVRIEENSLVPIVKFGEKCDGIWQEHKCGRPLGLKFDKNGNLYVVDAYYGIFKVNVATGEYKNIVNVSKPIDGKTPQLSNGIDIAKNGDLYWTDSNTDTGLYNIVMIFLMNPSGRLIRYNAAKKENEVLIRNLGFANGIALSDDESFIIVAESATNRITKYNLKGPKAGQHEIFMDGLPGLPDNIHSDGKGGFLVSLIITVDVEHPLFTQSLAPHPYLRKMLVRLLMAMELPFKLIHDIYPNFFAEKVLHAIGSFQIAELLIPNNNSLVLRIDASGNVIEILTADDGSVSSISSAYIHNGFLWLGSPKIDHLGRIPLKQVFPDLADSAKQSSRTSSEKQSVNAAASKQKEVKTERVKRDTKSTTAKSVESNKASATKPTAAPTTPKPTAAPTTTPKPTAAPKPSSVPKADKPTAAGSGNVKPSETKSSTAEVKDSMKTVGDAKSNTKSNSLKSEENSKKEDAAKTQSGKKVKVGQDDSIKQTAQKSPEKTKRVETNRPKDDL